jgi:hypothetical protein
MIPARFHQGGLIDQGAGYGHPLPLPTGQLSRQRVHALLQTQPRQEFLGPLPAGRIELSVQTQHQLDVLQGRQVGYEVVGLKGETDVAAAEPGPLRFLHRGQIMAVYHDAA